ncbi:MAG: LabA-like NYN domain-containing protein [Alphaproteobacteria bacterium]
MHFNPQERIALFIDGPNLYSAARSLGFDIDYKNLLDVFRQKGSLVRAFYYTALVEDQEYSPIRPLIDWLDYNGYTMVTKPAKEHTDASGRRKVKGNMDIELAIDMLEMAQHIDHAVLFSGDGDFRRLVEAVQRRGVHVTVVSTFRAHPPMVADELRRQADTFVELQDITRMPTTCRTSSKIRPRADQRRRTPKRVSTIATTCTKTPDHDQEHHRHR